MGGVSMGGTRAEGAGEQAGALLERFHEGEVGGRDGTGKEGKQDKRGGRRAGS